MADMMKSILMGLGCLAILGFVGCGMMGAGVIVAADRAAERSHQYDAPDRGEKSPWEK